MSPQVQGGAGQNCAQSHQALCPGAWSTPSAQPKAEVWRRGVKDGVAPCVEEGTVKRKLLIYLPTSRGSLPFIWPLSAGRADRHGDEEMEGL